MVLICTNSQEIVDGYIVLPYYGLGYLFIYLFLYKFHLLVFLFDGVGQDGKNEEFSPQLMSLSQVIPTRFSFSFSFFSFFLRVPLIVTSREDCCILSFWVLGSSLKTSLFFLLISPINLLLVLSFLLTPNNTQIQSDEEGFIYVQVSYLVLILPRMCSQTRLFLLLFLFNYLIL